LSRPTDIDLAELLVKPELKSLFYKESLLVPSSDQHSFFNPFIVGVKKSKSEIQRARFSSQSVVELSVFLPFIVRSIVQTSELMYCSLHFTNSNAAKE
jgi:hypothetical protein